MDNLILNIFFEAIILPTQSIVVQKDDTAPTTKRKLTFDDLIGHMKHYSPGTRKGEYMITFNVGACSNFTMKMHYWD